jgi:hypothetical protein
VPSLSLVSALCAGWPDQREPAQHEGPAAGVGPGYASIFGPDVRYAHLGPIYRDARKAQVMKDEVFIWKKSIFPPPTLTKVRFSSLP